MSSDMMQEQGKQLSIEGVDSIHGGMAIRRAREAQGMSLEELSGKLKVSVRKLDLIERGEFEKVTGGDAYLKALVRAMCKAVNIDPDPVLHFVPESEERNPLSHLHTSMAVPFASSGRMGKLGTGEPIRRSHSPSGVGMGSSKLPRISNAWMAGAMLAGLGALTLYAWPLLQPYASSAWSAASSQMAKLGLGNANGSATASNGSNNKTTPDLTDSTTTQNAGNASTSTGTAMSAVVQASTDPVAASSAPLASASSVSASTAAVPAVPSPAPVAVAATQAPAAATLSDENLTIEATEPTWVEVRNAKGLLLTQRNLVAGEKLEQDLNYRRYVVLGNVSGAKVWVRGKPFDVTSYARDKVARFEVE